MPPPGYRIIAQRPPAPGRRGLSLDHRAPAKFAWAVRAAAANALERPCRAPWWALERVAMLFAGQGGLPEPQGGCSDEQRSLRISRHAAPSTTLACRLDRIARLRLEPAIGKRHRARGNAAGLHRVGHRGTHRTHGRSAGAALRLAHPLGLPLNQSPPVIMRGVTGFATVPTIRVNSLTVGDLSVDSPTLPIVPDALGGAQGILGSEGLLGKRIFIDFRHDRISITFSRNEKSPRDFVDVPFHAIKGTLVVVQARVGDVYTKAIIDTGGETTIANLALRDALSQRSSRLFGVPDQITGATKDVQAGELIPAPAIHIGGIE